MPTLLSEGLFEADGQMHDEVFNDQAFKQSLMYAKGVVCSDCHDPHSAQLKAPGAQVCSQCHQPERFAGPSHTGHAQSAGSPDCIACHMPARTYMVVDQRHDHSFRIPRPDISARLGTPNTCNACHADKSAEWAAAAVTRWHGLARKGHQVWADAFHLARAGNPVAREMLQALAMDFSIPAVGRATALGELVRFPSVSVEATLRQGLKDPDPLPRIAALRNFASFPSDQRWRRIESALDDPILAVRVEAARLLADVKPETLSPSDAKRLETAFTHYEATQRLDADRPEARSNLAGFYLRQGKLEAAETEYLAGLKLAPDAVAIAVNLADLYRIMGREEAAEQALRNAVSVSPSAASPHHALGLSLIRQRRYTDALDQLGRAAELDPNEPHFTYVYGVALQSAGHAEDGRAVWRKALDAHPWEAALLNALLNDALGRGDVAEAAPLAQRLAALQPDDPAITHLSARLNPP
jgi:predicted CXXCH cytochrome family protein